MPSATRRACCVTTRAGDADPRARGDPRSGGAPMSELAERFETHDPGARQVGEKIRCDACPVMCYIADGRSGACDRYGNRDGRIVRLDPLVILEHAGEAGGRSCRSPATRETGTASWSTAAPLRHRDRRRHHLSRLQAGALHRQPGGRRRRHGDRRDRGHLQLLRRQGEDRHRPPSRPGDGDGARRRARRSAMSRPANTARRCCRSAASII